MPAVRELQQTHEEKVQDPGSLARLVNLARIDEALAIAAGGKKEMSPTKLKEISMAAQDAVIYSRT